MENDLSKCEYGCGDIALYVLKNKKRCCSEHCSKCPEVKKKNSKGCVLAYKEGRKDNSHMKGQISWRKGKNMFSDERVRGDRPPIFSENSHFTTGIVKRIIKAERLKEYSCEICKNGEEWCDKILVLELDHINGVRTDNRLENLRFLCPNCHSQTKTYKGRNKPSYNGKNKKISDSDLLNAINDTGSIRQALIKVGLDPKGGNYKRCYKLMYNTQLNKHTIHQNT